MMQGGGTFDIRIHNLPVVIKYGGAAMIDDDLKQSFIGDLVSLRSVGITPVVVHGGGREISTTAAALGVETTFVDGERYTSPEMIRVVTMVLAGAINKELVALLLAAGVNAAGISGIDGSTLVTQRRTESLGLVGDVTKVNIALIRLLLDAGIVPVVAPAGISRSGEVHNVNADRAASAITGALGRGSRLIYLSDVPGILVNGSLLSRLSPRRALDLISTGEISGGMIPKIRSALEALESGAAEVRIIDGRSRHALLRAMTVGDEGTSIINEERGSSFSEDGSDDTSFSLAS